MQHERATLERFAATCFVSFAAMLLLATVAWSIPFMRWDHLAFAPIYLEWQRGTLQWTELWQAHNEHLYAAPYAVLLVTTHLSHGHPWLECVISWSLLIAYGWIVLDVVGATLRRDAARGLVALLVFLALYPGHLVNLQWGWQVAVFLCITGAVVVIWRLGAATLSWRNNGIALCCACVALTSYATAAAVIPTAMILIALRREYSQRTRIAIAFPWMILGILVAMRFARSSSGALPSVSMLGLYVLNYLGGGVSRFVKEAAPFFAIAGIVAVAISLPKARGGDLPKLLPWLGFAVFGLLSGILIALGRAGPFGSDHALVTRYVSFSSMFWLGLVGMLAVTSRPKTRNPMRPAFLAVIAVFAVVNAIQIAKKAEHIAEDSRIVASELRASYPNLDETLVSKLYADDLGDARRDVVALHMLGFPPFENEIDSERNKR